MSHRHGGDRVVEVLLQHGVETIFTLCGGHISPILTGAKARGLRVIDARGEATAVFAADATSRLSGRPGIAAVTAGPGVTNALTAIKNSELAQSPLVLLGGATATVLKGRGALQDIDQRALVSPHVKWYGAAKRVSDLAPLVEEALYRCREGVPGPVFVEVPVDLLYPEATVRDWYGIKGQASAHWRSRVEQRYLRWHLGRIFAPGSERESGRARRPPDAEPAPGPLRRAAQLLAAAERPLLLVGSQATVEASGVSRLAAALADLGLPLYLSGMARGLLGADSPLQLRHRRKEALREADLVVLAGVPLDFRLDYGRAIRAGTRLVAINRSARDLVKNRRPTLAIEADAALSLVALAALGAGAPSRWQGWRGRLAERDAEREREIAARAEQPAAQGVDPLRLFRALDARLPDDSVLVADGGDFVATASYLLRPRRPLSWLDPGPFGTLGVGAGFALAAKLARPAAEVWLLWGDGAAGYGLVEIDSFVRHGLGVIALVGNDASWAQIARDQVAVLGDPVATVLARSRYEAVAEALGGVGLELRDEGEIAAVLAEAQRSAAAGRAVLVNVHLAASDFRQGSISI